MKLKASFTSIFFLLLLLMAPCSSSGRRNLTNMDSDIYIDYRGPETHPHNPSPNRSMGRHNGRKSKGIRATKPGLTHGKKNHG